MKNRLLLILCVFYISGDVNLLIRHFGFIASVFPSEIPGGGLLLIVRLAWASVPLWLAYVKADSLKLTINVVWVICMCYLFWIMIAVIPVGIRGVSLLKGRELVRYIIWFYGGVFLGISLWATISLLHLRNCRQSL